MLSPVEIIRTAGYAKVAGIYAVVHVQTGKLYVGCASSVKTRIGYHRSKLRHGKHDNHYLQNAWNLHGEATFKFFLLQKCPIPELPKWEAVWMKMTASCCRDYGYNLDSIASHKMHCEETKQKIAAGNTGKIMSKTTRQRISLSRTGIKHSEPRSIESRKHYSAALIGHSVSEETRRKIGAIHRGKTISKEQRQKISQTLVNTLRDRREQCRV
jgi:group I intron endonuclease